MLPVDYIPPEGMPLPSAEVSGGSGVHSFQAPRRVQVSMPLSMELGVHWKIPSPTEAKMNFRKL